MFKKIKAYFEARKRVKGLSKGMVVVDELMISGLKVQKLDQNYGKAKITLQIMHASKEITADELGAAMLTLKKRYCKLRRQAIEAELCA